MFAHFFIDRPIFAAVLSIVITLTGAIAVLALPIAQYPQITPPSVQVAITYPGASPQVVADTVAAPIEQQVTGVEGMLYMSSQTGTDGSYTLTVTFDVGTDLNTALVMVQNRVQLAVPQLPNEVQAQGITIRKKTPDILMVINFISPNGRYDDIYLSNFATINVKDEILRIDGVADIHILGERDYSIRAWLNPQKLAALNMTPMDVANAIRNQNLDAPAGQIGQPPSRRSQLFELPIDTLGRLTTPEQFADIIVKTDLGQTNRPAGQTSATSPASSSSNGQNSYGLPIPGSTSPLQSSGTTGSLSSSGTNASTTSNGTSTTLTSNGTTSYTSSTGGNALSQSLNAALSGGGTTGGGAMSTGGGTTGGGAATGGGGTTPSGLFSAGMTSQTSTSATNSLTTTLGLMTGVISAETMGRGSGRPSAGIVRLRDVARVELGSQQYSQSCTFDGLPSVGLAVFQLPGTNALDVSDRVKARMEELSTRFPDGVQYKIGYDITPFVRESVNDVVRTLFEAVILVGAVVLIFLQSWRAMIIPLVAVPVAIVGTFAAMAALNFSLNNISLFGLVLAIGIVVDDAIVVVENVERWLAQGLPAREATHKAMDEVTGPVIAVALVLCAVFVPCAFISGITGRFFRQFAVTISVSTVISALNSLTLSPALAAILLKPHPSPLTPGPSPPRGEGRDRLSWLLGGVIGWFFRAFNWIFGIATEGYARTVGGLLRLNLVVLLVYGGLVVLTYFVFNRAPTGFVPQQDQGRLIVNIQLPDSASQQRTQAALAKVERITLDTPGVAHTVTISGMSFVQSANSSNFASMFVVLEPFEKRKEPDLRDTAIMERLRVRWREQVKEAEVLVFGAPPIPGLSVASGFKLMVEDRGGLGLRALQEQTDKLITKLDSLPTLNSVSTQFRSSTPQLFLAIDRTKVASLGVALVDANQTLGMYLGSLYVNSFNEFGRHWQVNIQAEGRYRCRVADINLLQVRNKWGEMVPLGTLVNVLNIGGPVMVIRYNLATAAPITGNLAPGVSSGDAIAAIDQLASQTLPITMTTEWTELMFMQIRAGNTAIYVFALAVVCVFLVLAGLYESWSLPLAVILVVPLCLLCSVGGVLFTAMDVNIFVQIGLVVLVGLACKNSILIVEFARQLHQEGQPRFQAAREASRLRLRPILMTSLAFILGVMPLVWATGAGAEMRRSLGTAVFSGMLGVTAFGIFLTPVFFYVIQGLSEMRLFEVQWVRWLGNCLMGCLLGLVFGLLLAEVGLLRLPWALLTGGLVGVLAVLLVLGLHRRIWQA